jgi:sortase A
MNNVNSKENKSNVIRSGLNLSLPFVLCALALILLSIWAFNNVVEKNSYYKLLMNASVSSNTHDAFDNGLKAENIAPDPEGTDETLATDDDKIVSPDVLPPFKYGQKWGTFNIEKFDYYGRPIYNCDNPNVFGYGVGRALYAAMPGQGQNIVLCAHCVNSFIFLEELKIGDVIKIKTVYGVYEYEVVKRVVFEPDDESIVLAQYDEEMLTCYTCYPYLTTMPRTKRFAVISKKISGPDYRYNSATGKWYLMQNDSEAGDSE